MEKKYRLAIVFPAATRERQSTKLEQSRFARIATEIAALGIIVEGAPYDDEAVEQVRAQLLRVDGVLVWVNPIEGGQDRSVLNAMLADIAAAGVFVSAHPDVIEKMGTKEVLFRTQHLGWGCDTRHYGSLMAMRAELPASLASGAARVLKQMRGQSGDGVWKIEPQIPAGSKTPVISPGTILRVRHAQRGSVEEHISLADFISRCEPYFAGQCGAGQGGMIDQAYQPRLPDGMVRCYMVRDRVAGFGEQLVNALYPGTGSSGQDAPQPGPRLYYPPTRPDFQRLKVMLEGTWLKEMCDTLALAPGHLPAIWDADFLYGPKDAGGADTYVLCEINVSSVYPFPDEALAPLAAETLVRLKRGR
jgi:hypothetical protein